MLSSPPRPSSSSIFPEGGYRRASFIDAARGFAMLLVCLSHFNLFYFIPADAWAEARVMWIVGWPASSTFILISGIILGFLARQRGADTARLDIKLIDRGIFLLVPGHALIALAHVWIDARLGGLAWVFMTDAIGVCLIVGSLLVPRLNAARRAALGVTLFAFSWIVYFTWHPTGNLAAMARDVVFGERGGPGTMFSILPWLSAYLVATALGERLAEWSAAGRRLAPRLATYATACCVVGVIGHALHRGQGDLASRILSAAHKYPPSPIYFLSAGGIGLWILAAAAWIDARGGKRSRRVLEGFAVVGRSSLVVFIAQYFVYYGGFLLLHLPMSRLWPVYLLSSLALLYAIGWSWQRYAGNRYLTVGLLALVRAVTRPRSKGPRSTRPQYG